MRRPTVHDEVLAAAADPSPSMIAAIALIGGGGAIVLAMLAALSLLSGAIGGAIVCGVGAAAWASGFWIELRSAINRRNRQ